MRFDFHPDTFTSLRAEVRKEKVWQKMEGEARRGRQAGKTDMNDGNRLLRATQRCFDQSQSLQPIWATSTKYSCWPSITLTTLLVPMANSAGLADFLKLVFWGTFKKTLNKTLTTRFYIEVFVWSIRELEEYQWCLSPRLQKHISAFSSRASAHSCQDIKHLDQTVSIF